MASTKLLSSLSGARNLIYNPEGLLMQRIDPVTGTNVNNDVYGPDRWNVLCSTNAVNVKRSTDAPAGSRHSMQLQKATSSGFMGMCQMLEASESIPLAGQLVTFSVWLKSATLTSARIAVLGWSGTADSITSSIISAWGANSTYIANVAELGAANCTINSTWTQFSVTCSVSNANNLMLFVQTGSSATTSDSIFVSQAQCAMGTSVATYVRRSDYDELERCQRYYEKTYDIDAPLGTSTINGAPWAQAHDSSTIAANVYRFCVKKRAIPTVQTYSPQDGTAGVVGNYSGGVGAGFSSNKTATIGNIGTTGFGIGFATTFTAGTGLACHWIADAEL